MRGFKSRVVFPSINLTGNDVLFGDFGDDYVAGEEGFDTVSGKRMERGAVIYMCVCVRALSFLFFLSLFRVKPRLSVRSMA